MWMHHIITNTTVQMLKKELTSCIIDFFLFKFFCLWIKNKTKTSKAAYTTMNNIKKNKTNKVVNGTFSRHLALVVGLTPPRCGVD